MIQATAVEIMEVTENGGAAHSIKRAPIPAGASNKDSAKEQGNMKP